MLTYVFILTLYLTTMGGGGVMQSQLKYSSAELCNAFRKAVMTQLPDMNGHAGSCTPLIVPEVVQPETD